MVLSFVKYKSDGFYDEEIEFFFSQHWSLRIIVKKRRQTNLGMKRVKNDDKDYNFLLNIKKTCYQKLILLNNFCQKEEY